MPACGHDMHMTVWTGVARRSGGAQGALEGHADFHRPARRGDRHRRPAHARSGVVQEVPQAGLLPGSLHCDSNRHCGTVVTTGDWRLPTSIRWTSRSRARAGRRATLTPRSIRSFWRPGSFSTSETLVDGDQPDRPGGGDSRVDPRRHQATSSPAKSSLPAHGPQLPRNSVRKHLLDGIKRITEDVRKRPTPRSQSSRSIPASLRRQLVQRSEIDAQDGGHAQRRARRPPK